MESPFKLRLYLSQYLLYGCQVLHSSFVCWLALTAYAKILNRTSAGITKRWLNRDVPLCCLNLDVPASSASELHV
jgi:hypothetical protein